MTREEALLKLLALGPMTREEIVECTCWGAAETEALLQQLHARQVVGMHRVYCARGSQLFFLGGDIVLTRKRPPRGASGRAIVNARRSTFLPTTHHQERP
jgi:hypothetical protein